MDLNARPLLSTSSMRPAAQRIRLNSIWLLLSRLIVQAQLIVFTLLVARGLGVAGFGQYAFVAALIVLGNVATTFGTDTLLIREVARTRQASDGLIAATLWIQLLLSVAWLIVVVISANLLKGQAPEVVQALKIYSLSLIPLAFFTVFTSVLRAHERMEVYLLLNIVLAFAQLSGAWLVLRGGQGNLLSLVTMLNVVQLGVAIVAGILCRVSLPAFHFRWTVTRSQLMGVARLAWPFALLSALAVIYQRLGLLMLSTLTTDTQAGWYAAATRVIEPLKMLHFAVLGALLPTLSHLASPTTDLQLEHAARSSQLDIQRLKSRLKGVPPIVGLRRRIFVHAGGRSAYGSIGATSSRQPTTDDPNEDHHLATRLFRRSMLFLLIFSALAAGVIAVLAQPIVMLLFGASYAPSAEVVQLLAVSLIPYTISASLSLRLVTQGQERRVLWATMLSVMVAFILNRGLIPGYNSMGAALAVVVSESFLAMMLFILRH